MGSKVYPVQVTGTDQLRASAHSSAGDEGLSLLAINLDHRKPVRISLPQFAGHAGEKYILTALSYGFFGLRSCAAGRSLRAWIATPPLRMSSKPATVICVMR